VKGVPGTNRIITNQKIAVQRFPETELPDIIEIDSLDDFDLFSFADDIENLSGTIETAAAKVVVVEEVTTEINEDKNENNGTKA
jgi:hypothetical protein